MFNNKTVELSFDNVSEVVELTRVYKVKDSTSVKQQPITISLGDIATVRPSNRLGKENHRSTVTLKSGKEIELAEKYSQVTDYLEYVA